MGRRPGTGVVGALADEGFPIPVVDTDTYPGLAGRFSLDTQPTSLVFLQGTESARFPGVVPLEGLHAGLR